MQDSHLWKYLLLGKLHAQGLPSVANASELTLQLEARWHMLQYECLQESPLEGHVRDRGT